MTIFKRKTSARAAQAAPHVHPAIRAADEIGELAERIQELVGELGKDFARLVDLAEQLPKSCGDLKAQTLNRQRLVHALQQELTRAGAAAFTAARSELHGTPNFDELVSNAALGVHTRVSNQDQSK